ncbi:MAG: L-rhamnose/proton symporter RhaT [Pseudomonadota bacterium]
MIILWALGLVLIAGFINGSFATPMKYMANWKEENIWLVFSFWGFLILPWLTLWKIAPGVSYILGQIPTELMWTMILGGLAFGLGQIVFVTSFRYIGIGLAFVINISMGTSGSALIPMIWHKDIWGTTYSYVQLLGVGFFVLAVILGAIAGASRDKEKKSQTPETGQARKIKQIDVGKVFLGITLAILAGLGSTCQGVTYIWANPTVAQIAQNSHIAQLPASIIAWVIIFSAAWVPYVLYFLVLNFKNKSFSNLLTSSGWKYLLLTIVMGIGFWGSLIFFSDASNLIGGDLAPTIAWPIFMVFIILTSNFWSWKAKEWQHAGSKASKTMMLSLLLFVGAILVFSYSGKIKQHEVHYKHLKHLEYPVHR